MYIMEYCWTMKKEILPFAIEWMELESIVLSEIIGSEKDNYQMISLTCET